MLFFKKKIGRRLEKKPKNKVAADAWVEFRFSLCREEIGNTNKFCFKAPLSNSTPFPSY